MKIKPKHYKLKMDKEELQEHLKMKRQGNGAWKNKKAYDRKKRIM